MRGSVGFAGMRMGRATDKGDEFPPPHVLTPKAKDHNLIITPRIAARSGHLCPLRVRPKLTGAPYLLLPYQRASANEAGMSAMCATSGRKQSQQGRRATLRDFGPNNDCLGSKSCSSALELKLTCVLSCRRVLTRERGTLRRRHDTNASSPDWDHVCTFLSFRYADRSRSKNDYRRWKYEPRRKKGCNPKSQSTHRATTVAEGWLACERQLFEAVMTLSVR